MRTLLSVPPALSDARELLPEGLFVQHDPPDAKLGSGGGTAHLLAGAWKEDGSAPFPEWLAAEKRLLVHAGGQSRRLPAYAACGKAFVPVPVFRWITGQRIDQTLLDLQTPLLSRVLAGAPARHHTLVACGDVLVWSDAPLPPVPDADVVCIGLWDSPETASRHGVFFTPRQSPEQFEFMRQKPAATETLALSTDYLFLLDVGIWLLSDRAVEVLMKKCGWCGGAFADGVAGAFDLYGAFGEALGRTPTQPDPDVSALTCAVLPLTQAEFYHFGTSRDLINSSLALQNRVNDQRRIRSPLPKPHPSMFVQNAPASCPLGPDNQQIWIENAHVGAGWGLSREHVLTGIPENNWTLTLPPGVCLDFVPVDETEYALRVYGFDDAFRGAVSDPATHWLGRPAAEWFTARGLPVPQEDDLQHAALFPVVRREELSADLLRWMFEPSPAFRAFYTAAPKLSAETLGTRANLKRSFAQRRASLSQSLPALVRHAHRSVFHQIDLHHAASVFAASDAGLPTPSSTADRQLFPFIHDCMFRATVKRLRGDDGAAEEAQAFQALRDAIVTPLRRRKTEASNTALADQVVWARSPVRLDLAGGWTDTPPYCFLHGGSVVNLAVELNGQPPIQVFARVSEEPVITLRSIDLGISARLEDYADVGAYADVNSGFSIPRAALALAGFHPDFQPTGTHASLKYQLEAFGGGIELTLLSAIPKGSGLGTSSLLAATVLGALSELGGLNWDRMEIASRVLALEQMLTSGGGWQDPFGGVTRGLKLLRTGPGLDQVPEVRWLPDYLFTDPLHKSCFLLYYTGVTRVAKHLLAEIVRGMFLNRSGHLATLEALARHARSMFDLLQRGDYAAVGHAVRQTWEWNCRLDPGTCPPEIAALMAPLQDWVYGMKLLGAGGGGYLLMLAKDAEAAARIRHHLQQHPPNARARFVDFELSHTGLQVTRS